MRGKACNGASSRCLHVVPAADSGLCWISSDWFIDMMRAAVLQRTVAITHPPSLTRLTTKVLGVQCQAACRALPYSPSEEEGQSVALIAGLGNLPARAVADDSDALIL